MKRILFLFLIPFSILLAVFIVRFFIGGAEDNWICVNNQWVKHGNPISAKPQTGCGEENSLTCSGLTLGQAREIAKESNCLKEGTLKDNFSCNNYTKTWWIDLVPNSNKEGCNPACVVNTETKKAEVNWRCTGLAK
ncbi:hypothetical protein M1349_03640 [Patescibacteria group bacterium]|nr:hypothetical protein [Patescibacteria group bacterium]